MKTSTTPTSTMNTTLENDSRSSSSNIPYSFPSSISSGDRRMGMPRPLYHANMIPSSLFHSLPTTSSLSSPNSSPSSSSSIFNVLDDVLGNDHDINDNDCDEQQLLRRQETTSKTSSSMFSFPGMSPPLSTTSSSSASSLSGKTSTLILLSRALAVLDAHDEQEVEELEVEADNDTMMIDYNDSSPLNSATTTTKSSSNNNANISDHFSTRFSPQ